MMLHQDASARQWIEGDYWDLVVTLDAAGNEHYPLFFIDEEGAQSSLRGCRQRLVQPLAHRPGQPLLDDPRGGRQSGQSQPDPVWPR